MPLCNERDALCLEMSEIQMEPDRSVLILINHCKEMKRQERLSRIVTCFLFLVLSAVFFLYTQTHSSLDCKHSKSDLEHSTNAHYQRQIESRPNAHLTAAQNCPNGDFKYLEWESKDGDAHLHMFNYSNNALIAHRDGNYSIYLQITYRMIADFPCSSAAPVQLKQQVFHGSDRYPEETLLMMALDTINCSESNWRKSLSVSRMFPLEKGDLLMVKAENLALIDCGEKKMFFGAYLI